MKRRKIWYRRNLFKNHFRSYKDWDSFNPPSDFKHPVRYKSDALICRNEDCPREQMPISEHEAYYYFAKRRFHKRLVLHISYVFRFWKSKKDEGGCYICPFCGGGDVEEIKAHMFIRDPRERFGRTKTIKAGRSSRF